MGKLPKAIIKKYGISKKAWSVYRSERKSTTRKVSKVARKKKSRGKRKGMNPLMGRMVGGVGYGLARGYLNQLAQPLTAKLGVAGRFADELTMGLISYALATGKIPFLNKMPITREIGKAGLTIEAFSVGQELSSSLPLGGSSPQSGNVPVV